MYQAFDLPWTPADLAKIELYNGASNSGQQVSKIAIFDRQ